MTEPFDEYGDRLRRALHAEADAIVPSAEGLEQIRTKIAKRGGRRFEILSGLFTGSWLRPLAAVAGAILIAIVAVSTTPAIRNFVQTGHFSSDGGQDGGADGGHDNGQNPPPPGSSVGSDRGTETPQSSISPSSPGAHTLAGTCPPGEVVVPVPSRRTAHPSAEGTTRTTFTCRPAPTVQSPEPNPPPAKPTTSSPTTAPPPEQPTPNTSGQESP